MEAILGTIANRIARLLQRAGAQVDLEVLQWPGGSLIALLLLIRAMTAAAFDTRRLYDV
jgi:hypothetical protein